MKKITQFIAALFLIFNFSYENQKVFAQNLVPNPSFEDTLFCPLYLTQIYAAANWLNYGISPDYYNSCNNSGVNVPNAVFGYQYAHSGNGMAGIFLRRRANSPDGPNAKEFIATELNTTLNIGSKYYFSCFINFSYIPQAAIACNKFGMKLSTVPYDSSQFLSLINNFAHVYSDSIVSDTVQWFKLSGSLIADSNYHFLILGNFFDDQSTDTVSFSPAHDFSYYYIDDVCLGLDSNFCDTWTLLQHEIEMDYDFINIFPIPTSNYLNIQSDLPIINLKVYDTFGKIQYVKSGIHNNKYQINISHLSNGMYFLNIKTTKTNSYKSFVKS